MIKFYPDKSGKFPDISTVSCLARLHSRLIKLVVGKRPVIMNVTIGIEARYDDDDTLLHCTADGLFSSSVTYPYTEYCKLTLSPR